MIKVTFNYDPDTNIVSDVTATGADVKASSKVAKVKVSKSSDKVILKGGSLQLNQDVLDLLGVVIGDRLCVRFDPQPVLVRPDIAKEAKGGNLITKSLTISVKGKASDTIAEHGTEFEYNLKSDGYLSLVTDTTVVVQEDKPIKEEIEISDLDFLADIEDGVEIDFTLEIQ